jgi:hypothetical protein
MRIVIVPAVAEQTISRCYDCPHFERYGAAYQDGSACGHPDYVEDGAFTGDEIPEWCPLEITE